MKLDKLKKGKEIDQDIEEKKDLLENVKKLLPKDDSDVEVKIRGTKFHLPKKFFVVQLDQKIKAMEGEVASLEDNLDKL